ncbi:MAG TPA: hypothetical protein DDZ80_30975 [Cyanobacteria bacterium UBA8803]|nr:hypothetical protein [Cyanobacteria bacterium UBA9273]HBL62645.1 hypothetical protein [Cyanobacteria bacterium UBA8803]
MANSATSESREFSQNSKIWNNLKQAIATSSGFQRWQMEHLAAEQLQEGSLEYQVRRYLRETLETLAY